MLLNFDDNKNLREKDIVKLFDKRYGKHRRKVVRLGKMGSGNNGNFFVYHRWKTKRSTIYLLNNIWIMFGAGTERLAVFYSSRKWAGVALREKNAEVKKVQREKKAGKSKKAESRCQ